MYLAFFGKKRSNAFLLIKRCQIYKTFASVSDLQCSQLYAVYVLFATYKFITTHRGSTKMIGDAYGTQSIVEWYGEYNVNQ